MNTINPCVASVAFQPFTIDMVATALADIALALSRYPSVTDFDYDVMNVAVSVFLLGCSSRYPHNEVVQKAMAISDERRKLSKDLNSGQSLAQKKKTRKKKRRRKKKDRDRKNEKESYRNMHNQKCVRFRTDFHGRIIVYSLIYTKKLLRPKKNAPISFMRKDLTTIMSQSVFGS